MFVRLAFNELEEKIPLPCRVVLTRLSKRFLDQGDNLPMAFKYIRDQVADCLLPGLAIGQADASPLITWEYAQEKRALQGIRIEIYSA